MTNSIININNSIAGQIANKLDNRDGHDNKITANIWEQFWAENNLSEYKGKNENIGAEGISVQEAVGLIMTRIYNAAKKMVGAETWKNAESDKNAAARKASVIDSIADNWNKLADNTTASDLSTAGNRTADENTAVGDTVDDNTVAAPQDSNPIEDAEDTYIDNESDSSAQTSASQTVQQKAQPQKQSPDVVIENQPSSTTPQSSGTVEASGVVMAATGEQVDVAAMNADKNFQRIREQNPNATSEQLNQMYQDYLRNIDNQRTAAAQDCFRTDCSEALTEAINARYEQEVAAGRTTRNRASVYVNKPNGDVNDNVPVQKTGNCWGHGGLNSIGSTTDGEAMLAAHIEYDEEKGITAVHFKEAENNKKGYKGTGVYTITDIELAEANKTSSANEGDVTAYTLAARMYLRDLGQSDDGTLDNDRMFQMISGIKTNDGNEVQDPHHISMGISNMYSYSISDGKHGSSKYDYETLKNGIQNGGMACCLNVRTTDDEGHVISVVGVNPNTGNIMVQESNNTGHLNELYNYMDKDGNTYQPFKFVGYVNGAPTYEMSETAYNCFISGGSVYRWA